MVYGYSANPVYSGWGASIATTIKKRNMDEILIIGFIQWALTMQGKAIVKCSQLSMNTEIYLYITSISSESFSIANESLPLWIHLNLVQTIKLYT